MNTPERPVFSICIPAYNVEQYLRECLDSVASQTFTDFEAICVDDGSTDASGQILDEYAEKDPRFRVIHQENKGLLAARQPSFAAARGRYILVLDSDDKFSSPTLLEELFQLAEKEGVDILEFSAECFGAGGAAAENMQKLLEKHAISFNSNYSMISECYEKKHILWNVWAKCYSAEIIKKAIQHIEEAFLTTAEDLYQSFLFYYFSNTYKYVQTSSGYCYRIGSGVTTQSTMTPRVYRNNVQQARVCGFIEGFLKKQDDLERFAPILEKIRTYCFDVAIYSFHALPAKSRGEGLGLLFRHHPVEKVLHSLYERYGGSQADFAASICGAPCLEPEAKPVRTIGIFYHRYYEGGVERVISHHIPMLQKLGYEVVLLTEDIDPAREYPLPDGVTRVLLPRTYPSGGGVGAGEERFSLLCGAIRQYGIGLVLYHASSSPLALFDLLAVKSLKAKLVLIRHEPTALDLMWLGTQAETFPYIFRLADKLVVLSRCEEHFYRQMGVDAAYIQNPVFRKSETEREEGGAPTVLWLGRLDERQKQYRDALAIMKKVLEAQPGAQCVMVGGEETPGAQKQVERFIAENRLEGKLRYLPYTPDVAGLYRRASVHLLTSRFEMFPMVIAESKSYGLPLVAYDLPTLEFFQDPKGMITVPQNDTEAAAAAVLSLLEDDGLRQKMGRQARESLEPYLAFDLPGRWRALIEELANKQGSAPITEGQRLSALMWSEAFAFYKTGLSGRGSVPQSSGLFALAGKTLRSLRENGVKETLRKIRRKLAGM
ncbi:MAG: glycosyltransferase [Desulfovibrionaceae bacterium]|nr:glycosyltransferase [Desulfovibrionaceae bacterium]